MSQHEAARAVKTSERSGENIRATPENRERVEKMRNMRRAPPLLVADEPKGDAHRCPFTWSPQAIEKLMSPRPDRRNA
jgi:hypothetical protein